MLDLAIVVVSYGTSKEVATLFTSVDRAAGDLSWHLIIVDNAREDSPEVPFPRNDRVSVIRSPDNLGYSGGLNLGLDHAPVSRRVVFLNPDLELEPDSLSILSAAVDAGAAAAVPRILDGNGFRQDSLRREPSLTRALGEALLGNHAPGRPGWSAEVVRDPSRYEQRHSTDWATGAALMVDSTVVTVVGRWDDARFFMYSEETDYSRRIRLTGGRVDFVPAAVVRHLGGGSGSSPALDALQEVNKIRYYNKWHGKGSTALFGLVTLLRNLARPHKPGARAAIRALLSSSARSRLPGGRR